MADTNVLETSSVWQAARTPSRRSLLLVAFAVVVGLSLLVVAAVVVFSSECSCGPSSGALAASGLSNDEVSYLRARFDGTLASGRKAVATHRAADALWQAYTPWYDAWKHIAIVPRDPSLTRLGYRMLQRVDFPVDSSTTSSVWNGPDGVAYRHFVLDVEALLRQGIGEATLSGSVGAEASASLVVDVIVPDLTAESDNDAALLTHAAEHFRLNVALAADASNTSASAFLLVRGPRPAGRERPVEHLLQLRDGPVLALQRRVNSAAHPHAQVPTTLLLRRSHTARTTETPPGYALLHAVPEDPLRLQEVYTGVTTLAAPGAGVWPFFHYTPHPPADSGVVWSKHLLRVNENAALDSLNSVSVKNYTKDAFVFHFRGAVFGSEPRVLFAVNWVGTLALSTNTPGEASFAIRYDPKYTERSGDNLTLRGLPHASVHCFRDVVIEIRYNRMKVTVDGRTGEIEAPSDLDFFGSTFEPQFVGSATGATAYIDRYQLSYHPHSSPKSIIAEIQSRWLDRTRRPPTGKLTTISVVVDDNGTTSSKNTYGSFEWVPFPARFQPNAELDWADVYS